MTEKQDIFSLMGGAVKMHRGIYNPTSDAVWLAAFAGNTRAKTVLDIGVGTGGVILCLMQHLSNIHATGIDVSNDMLGECARNAILNGQEIELINADILALRTSRTFDLVVTNPPYFRGTPSVHHGNAHHNTDLLLWIKRSIARVRPNGWFYTIIDSSRVADVISVMNNSCGDINIFPLFGAKKTAERVLLSGRVGSRGITVIHTGLSMGCTTILRDGLTIKDTLAKLA